MTTRPRAYIYVRVSTSEQTAEHQIPPCRALCDRMGFDVVEIFQETASGSAAGRPVWAKLLTKIRKGRADVLVVWALDRIGRTLYAISDTVRALDRLGVPLYSVQDGWLSQGMSPELRPLLLGIFDWLASVERNRLIERTRASHATARRAGKRIGRPPRVTTAMVNWAFPLVEDGLTWSAIADRVTKHFNLRPPMSKTTIHRALTDRPPAESRIPSSEAPAP